MENRALDVLPWRSMRGGVLLSPTRAGFPRARTQLGGGIDLELLKLTALKSRLEILELDPSSTVDTGNA